MKFLGRAGILFLTSLFLITTSFADGNQPDRTNKAGETSAAPRTGAAGNLEPGSSSGAVDQADATAPVTTSSNPEATPAAKPAAKRESSRPQEGNKEPRKWKPMAELDGNPGLFGLETGETLPKGGFNLALSVNKF